MNLFFVILCVLLYSVVGAHPGDAAPTNKLSHTQGTLIQGKPEWNAQNNALPTTSGPGIVVCEPVTATGDAVSSQFGSGCALWLQMIVGGQPQFGKTPVWDSLGRARTELGRPDLQLSQADALPLAPILGVTHVVVGTLRGAEPHIILRYQLLQVPLGKPVGAAITLAGTQVQIAAGLPQIARILTKRLGGTTAALPQSTDLTPLDLQLLGQLRWQKTARTDAQQAALELLAVHNPVAGLVNLSRHGGWPTPHFSAAAQVLLMQDGGNPLIWSTIAEHNPLTLLPHTSELAALVARYPENYNLAVAETLRYLALRDRPHELQSAERMIKDAPHSPGGWFRYASAIDDTAEDLRQGRVYNALSPTEADTLNTLYLKWEAASRHSVQLDPAYAPAWLELATAATFNSDNSDASLADHALQTALTLSEDKAEVYQWALQMYQPKWNDEPFKLTQFAQMAASDTMLTADEILYLAPELKSIGSPELQAKMLNDFTSRQHSFLILHPNDGSGHFDLATILEAAGNTPEAKAEYQRAAALLPENARVHYHLGLVLFEPGTYEEAIVQFQKALKIDPDFPQAHFFLARVLGNMGHFEDEKRELKTALQLNPAYGEAYQELGTLLLVENNFAEAIPNYQAAIQLGIRSRAAYENLIRALSAMGQYEQVVTTGEAALRIYRTGSSNIFDGMADAYLHQKEWEKSLASSQAAVALNNNDPVAHENLAEAYLGLGRISEAQSEWKEVLTFNDDRETPIAEGFLKKYP